MKCIRFSMAIAAMLYLTVGLIAPAQADVDIIAKAAIGSKSSELDIRGRSFAPDFLTLDLSLTGAMGNFFITFNNEFSIKDDISSYADPDPAPPDMDGLLFYSRDDTNLTFGYSFEIASVFMGVRSGETNAYYTANSSAFGTTSKGYYVGVSKSFFYKDKGALSGSIAVASLDGEVALSEPFVDTTAFQLQAAPATIKGSALGLSLGIGWSGTIYGDTNYNIDLKHNQFDFQDDVVFGGLDLSYTENFTTFYIGITHFF